MIPISVNDSYASDRIHDGKVLLYKGEHTAASMFEVISYNADPSKRKLGWELPVAKASYVRQLQFDLYNWIQQTVRAFLVQG